MGHPICLPINMMEGDMLKRTRLDLYLFNMNQQENRGRECQHRRRHREEEECEAQREIPMHGVEKILVIHR
ncbi:hypothetical protein V6Z11_D12G174500 [Gossypium hirsutum]